MEKLKLQKETITSRDVNRCSHLCFVQLKLSQVWCCAC